MKTLLAALAFALLLLPALPASAQRASSIARQRSLPVPTSQSAAVRQALRDAERRHEETIALWMRTCRVAALPGEEAERAKLVAGFLEDAGLRVRIRSDGNVEAIYPGSRPGRPAVISAHLDALHAPSPENPVRRNGDTLEGPGVLDDGSGLAALVGAARYLQAAGYRPEREIRFLATVEEEVGLKGAHSYFADDPQLAAFVSIDGILGAVDYGATGITWLRYTFTGRGGHTLLSQRTPSPSFAAGRAIAAIAALAEDTDDPLNVGSIHGGERPNAVPTEVSFTVDLRSEDAVRLRRLERDLDRVVRAAASREGVNLQVETLQALPAARLPGHARSALVSGAAEILEWLDLPATTFPRGSSDHNVALLKGVPAIAVGATLGRHAHAPRETADAKLLASGVQQVILLAVLLGEGLDDAHDPRRTPSAQ
jgi:acetylornithine deacetylase/succinyl-diaminopimelate desuccinylase-like protein